MSGQSALNKTTPTKPGVTPSRAGLDRLNQARWGAFTSSYAALASSSVTRSNILCLGDSITEGFNATSYDRTWIQMLARILRARLGLSLTGGRGFIGARPGTTSMQPIWPAVRSSGTSFDQTMSPNRSAALLDAVGQTITFSLVGTSADIVFRGGFGTFSYSVDGGATTNVDATTGGNLDGRTRRVTLGSAGAHTLAIALVSGSGFYLDGVIEYNGDETSGLLVHNAGHSAWDSSSWVSGPPVWANTAQWPNAISVALTPSIITVMLGANDLFNGISAASYKANIQALIAGLRQAANLSTVPFLLIAPYRRGSSDYSAVWPAYVQGLRDIEASDPGVVVCDLNARMPPADATQTFSLYSGDKIHPTDKGMALIAATVADFLLPR